MSEIGSNFSKIIESKGIKKSEVARATGIPYSCFTDWTHGRYIPKLDKIHKIADYLGVSPAILLDDSLDIYGVTQVPCPEDSNNYVEVVDLYSKLNEKDRMLIIQMMNNMYERELLLKKYVGVNETPTS